MSKIVWDKIGERFYETGVSNGVLYNYSAEAYANGVPWNGLTAVTESPSGAEATPIYADNIKYLNLTSIEEFGGTIEAYASPKEFDKCDGTATLLAGVSLGQQTRETFGLSYKTLLGNDVDKNDYGYKLHLVYGAIVTPSERPYSTVSDSPEPPTLSWEFTTTPVEVTTMVDGKKMKATSLLTIDSTVVSAADMLKIEEILYGKDPTTEGGSDGIVPRLPLPDEVFTILNTSAGG